MRRALTVFAAVLAMLVGGLVALTPTDDARAVTGSQFDPGNIVSDQLFYDGSGMSAPEIQSFLNARVPVCETWHAGSGVNQPPFTCLKDFVQAVPTMPADRYCAQINGGMMTAAQLIAAVGVACNMNPKAMLVLLQKEQSLVTDTWPWRIQYNHATGFSCPDTAPCDPAFEGFFYQVYYGARQFQIYRQFPGSFNFRAGGTFNIQYHPNAACGTRSVTIANAATAGLYNYTPYTPNASALANLYGVGDACGSYGNRNFWRLWWDWFGSPNVPAGTPTGELTVESVAGGVRLTGWAVDPDAPAATVSIAVQLGSVWRGIVADRPGANRSPTFPGAGSNHDFDATLTAAPGNYTMCVYLVNAGGAGSDGSLGCRTVTVLPLTAPVGAVLSATMSGSRISVTGWAVRPDAPTAAVDLAINIGSTWTALKTGTASTQATAAVPGAGPNQGFAGLVSAPAGLQTVCVWAARTSGPAVNIGCTSLLVPAIEATQGRVTNAVGGQGTITVNGWAVWTDALTAKVPVAVNVGAAWHAATANTPSTAAESAVPGSGPGHGFSVTVPAAAGQQTACVWAAQQGAASKLLGCASAAVSATGQSAVGAIETVTSSANGLTVTGWSVWPSVPTGAVPVALNVGGSWWGATANAQSAAAATAVPAAGTAHGFTMEIPVPVGTHTVCLWASLPAGGAVQIGCANGTRTAPASVLGSFDVLASGVGGLHYEGWAVQPDAPAAAVPIALNVGASWIPISTGRPSAAAVAAFGAAGPSQGFEGLLPLPVGSHTVCAWAASSTGPKNIGCRTATVSAAPATVARITEISTAPGTITVSGWAVWPSTSSTAVPVALNVGGTWVSAPSGVPSTATADWVFGAGPNQGFSGSIAAPSGSQSVCVWVSQQGAASLQVECRTVTVP